MKNLRIRTKLTILVGFIIAITTLSGIMSVYNLKKVDAGVVEMYEKRVVPLAQLKEVVDAYAVDIVDLAHKSYHGNITFEEALERLEKATVVISDNWSAYEGDHIIGKERVLVDEARDFAFKK